MCSTIFSMCNNKRAMNKISIRFFNDREVRAIWDDDSAKWWFSVPDILGVLNAQDNYTKNRNYWKYLKSKLREENNQLVSATNQLKIKAPDGKMRLTDVLDARGVVELAKSMPNTKSARFVEWFTNSDETIDGKSKSKAYALFGSSLMDSIEVGTLNGLKQIHAYIFGGLYDFAGRLRTVNISKGGFTFASAEFLEQSIASVEKMPENSFEQIVDKYVEMNVAHPFREGNGRATRIWLDLMLKRRIGRCVDWSKIDKRDYLAAMERSVADSGTIKHLLQAALTDKVDDREMFMKGIDYSYYYEETE